MTFHPLTETLCPRPANGDPDGITAAECIRLGHCGCDEVKRMAVHPLILAGAKAVEAAFDAHFETWSERWLSPAGLDEGAPDPPRRTKCSSEAIAEAVIRAVAPGLLTGTHAVLPVEATEEMYLAGHAPLYERDLTPSRVYRVMVAAHLKAEKQG